MTDWTPTDQQLADRELLKTNGAFDAVDDLFRDLVEQGLLVIPRGGYTYRDITQNALDLVAAAIHRDREGRTP